MAQSLGGLRAKFQEHTSCFPRGVLALNLYRVNAKMVQVDCRLMKKGSSGFGAALKRFNCEALG